VSFGADREPIRFFLTGPVYVLEEVRREMTRPIVAHRSPEFRRTWDAIAGALPPILRTGRPGLVATGSATLLMEASIVSLSRDSTLHLTNGAFSERWLAVARSHGRDAAEVSAPWGRAIDPDDLRHALRGSRPEVVTVVHSETSTGVLNPIEQLARVVREESDALLLVDTVSSLGGAPVETDAWGLDFVFAGVQKGLAAPPGLTVFAFSERAERRAETIPHRGFYTDLLRYRDHAAEGGPITTPAVAECYALARQLDRVLDEGMEARWRRHAGLAATTAHWAERHGFRYRTEPADRSPTVSCLEPPDGLAPGDLKARLAARGFTVASGYGRFKTETFRIGHMGEVGPEDLAALLAVIEEECMAWTAS